MLIENLLPNDLPSQKPHPFLPSRFHVHLTDEGLKGQIWEPLCKEYSGTTAEPLWWLRSKLPRRMNTPEM